METNALSIVMCLDECPAHPQIGPELRKACACPALGCAIARAFGDRPGHALFGIQQGATGSARRKLALRAIEFDGYAIGGLAVGEGQEAMFSVLDYAPDMMPSDKPLSDGRRQT